MISKSYHKTKLEVIMLRLFTILGSVFISLTTLANELLPVCESIIVQTEDRTIMDSNKGNFTIAYEGPRIKKGDRVIGFLDDTTGNYDRFYRVSGSGDLTQLMGFDSRGSSVIGNLDNILGLIFKPDSQIASQFSIDEIVVFCGNNKNKVLQKRAAYAQRRFLTIKPFSEIAN
jgi:hypothetical protein